MIKKIYQKYKCLIYIIIVAIFMFLLQMIVCKIYPFGEKSMIAGDIAGQYIPFWVYLKNCFLGQDSILFTFAKGLGGNMIGVWAYYLMSPYNIIFFLFSNHWITEAIVVVTGLKMVSCAITMYFFLKEKITNKWILAILSLSYAFCGYNIAYHMNVMWLDNIILLPLMVLGVEKITRENKFKMYVITLALSFIVNFYTGYATAIFTGLYFLYDNLSQKIQWKKRISQFLKFAGYSLLGIGLSAIILLPVIFTLQTGKGTEFIIDWGTAFSRNFELLNLGGKLLIGALDSAQLGVLGLPNIYVGLLTLLLAEIYFFNPNISIRKKIFTVAFLFIILISFQTKLINLIWHGLKEPVGFPYRYSFILSFLLIAISAKALTEEKRSINWKWVPFITLVDIGIIWLIKMQENSFLQENLIYLSIFVILFYGIMLSLQIKFKKAIFSILISIVCVMELLINAIISFNQMVHSVRDNYMDDLKYYDKIITQAKEYDSSFYRMEKEESFFLNDSLLFNYNGVGHSSSTFEQKQLDFMKKIGYNWYIYFPSYGYGNTLLTDSILGIKYKIAKGPVKYYEPVKELEDGMLYKNNYPLTIGYVTDKKAEEIDMEQNPFEIQTDLLNQISNNNLEYFNDIPLKDFKMVGIKKDGNYYTGEKEKSYIELTFDIRNVKEELYFWITTPYALDGRAFKVYVNDKYYEEYLGMNKNGVLKIKNIENTDTLKLKLEFNVNDTIELNEFILKELNLVNFEKAYKQVQEKQIENIEFKNSTLKATVNIKNEKSYVFTTIPYDEGWSLEANGKKVDVENSNGFVTFALEKGKQEIKLSYMPKGLKAGMVITGISIVIFIALIQVKKYKKMRN